VFRGLVHCGECGHILTPTFYQGGEYRYYRCNVRHETSVKEEELDAGFLEALQRIRFDDEVMGVMVAAMKSSHADQRREQEVVVKGLRAQYDRLQRRLDGLYKDKLDGVIDLATYQQKSAEWRDEPRDILHRIERRQEAEEKYLEDAQQLLQIAQRVGILYESATCEEKQKILKMVISKSIWKDGKLLVEYRKPFCYLVDLEKPDPDDDGNAGGGDGFVGEIPPAPLSRVQESRSCGFAAHDDHENVIPAPPRPRSGRDTMGG
jgi:hypothetical protein